MRVVLNEERLLAVVSGLVEEKIGRRGRIEDGLAVNLSGGDVVGKLFVNEAVDRVGSNFDFVVIEVGGDGGADIAFAETTVLNRPNGPGRCIGREAGFVIAHATLHGALDAGRKGGLIRRSEERRGGGEG